MLVPSLAEGGLSFAAVEASRSGCQVFMNESLGRIEGDIPNVHYLPLEKEAWVRELGKVDLSSVSDNRKTRNLPALYFLERSMGQYVELCQALLPVETKDAVRSLGEDGPYR